MLKPPQEILIKNEEPFNFQNKKFPLEIPQKNIVLAQNKPNEDEDEIMKMIRSQIKIQYPQKS